MNNNYEMKETIIGDYECKFTTIKDNTGYETYLDLSINGNLDNFGQDLNTCIDLTIRDIDHEIEKLSRIRNTLVDMKEPIDSETNIENNDRDNEVKNNDDELLLGDHRVEYVESILAPFGYKLKIPYMPIISPYATFDDGDGGRVVIGTLKEKDTLKIWSNGLQLVNIPEYDFSQLKGFVEAFKQKYINW